MNNRGGHRPSLFLMPKTDFAFFASILLLITLGPALELLEQDLLNSLAIASILLFGIPHGSIDNQLYLEKSSISKTRFYSFYLGAIALNALLWFIFPLISLGIFVLISAYHFGQSQLSDILKKSNIWSFLLYTIWGASVIFSFAHFNIEEIQAFTSQEKDLMIFSVISNSSFMFISYLLSTSLCLIGMNLFVLKGKMKGERFAFEMLVLFVIQLSAFLFSFLIGFAFFFVLIHSFRVLQKEFNHLFDALNLQTFLAFIKKLMPFSLLSFIGIGLIVFAISMDVLYISIPLFSMIIISSITLPHAFVMEKFYSL